MPLPEDLKEQREKRKLAYKLLGFDTTIVDPKEVERAFRRLVKRHHPDLNDASDANKLKSIINAYKFVTGENTEVELLPESETEETAGEFRRDTKWGRDAWWLKNWGGIWPDE